MTKRVDTKVVIINSDASNLERMTMMPSPVQNDESHCYGEPRNGSIKRRS